MVQWPYFLPTTKQITLCVCGLLTGAALIAVGTHLSYANVAPQQARTQARKQYVKARLRKFLED